MKRSLRPLAPDFERRTGHGLVIDNDTAGVLARRIAYGEQFEVVVLDAARAAMNARGLEPAGPQ